MRDETITTDLSRFGYRELRMAAELLTALTTKGGCWEDFNLDEVTVMMNANSGYVFLTNADFQVAMMNGDRLESFYSCPECGHEGFAEDMAHDGNAECRRYLEDIGVLDSADDDETEGAE